MKLKQTLSSILTAAMLATSCIMYSAPTAYAETTYTSPADLVFDAVTMAVSDVESSTKTDALNAVKSATAVTVNDIVKFNSISVGTWYASDPNTIYTDAEKSAVLLTKTSEGFDVNPEFLNTVLSYANERFIETYVPTTDDLTKIIGKYDITLSADSRYPVKIPANCWFPMNISTSEDISNTEVVASLTSEKLARHEGIIVFAWCIDDTNRLYISNSVVFASEYYTAHMGSVTYQCTWSAISRSIGSNTPSVVVDNVSGGSLLREMAPYVRVGLVSYAETDEDTVGKLKTFMYTTNNNNSVVNKYTVSGDMTSFTKLNDVHTYESAYSKTLDSMVMQGVVAVPSTNYSPSAASYYGEMDFTTKVEGNTTLTRRLNRLSTMSASDTITILPTTWKVNGGDAIDTYIATQEIEVAGSSVDVNAVAEIEELSFKVVVPTSLPLFVDNEGNVSSATNASVENKSNAAVKIIGIEALENQESGWHLVQGTPSDVRGANEFKFDTSLEVGDIILRGDELPFSYSVVMSPAAMGTKEIDLATVTLTVDWRDEVSVF